MLPPPSAELIGAPKALVGWLLDDPKVFPLDGPPNKPPVEVLPPPNAGLLGPPNRLPELVFAFVDPKPPNPVEAPAVAVLFPNILALVVAVLPKAGLAAPNGVEVLLELEPNPDPVIELISEAHRNMRYSSE